MSSTSTPWTEHLPPALRHLDPEQVEELERLARLKAWVKATERPKFSKEEQRLIDRAEREESPEVVRRMKERVFRHRLWESLSWFLFGGYVDLVGFRVDPRRAYDPDTNPWIQLRVPGFAYTQDEHDEAEPFKPLPDKEYLRLLAYAWVHEPLLAVPKSRQMMITWLFCAIAAHRVLFGRAQRIAIISKKEEDANELLKRIKVVCDGIPREYAAPRAHHIYCHLSVQSTNGNIHAMSEQAKGLRSFTWSWIFSDEAAFQEQFDEHLRAGLAAARGGGRFSLVSTSNGEDGFYNVISEGGAIPCPPGA